MTPEAAAHRRRRCATAVALLVGAASGACSGGDRSPPTGAVVDTLPSGAVRVASGAEGAWSLQESLRWGLAEELRIGRIDGQGPDVFGRIGAVLPDALGRIWLVDTQAYEVRVFAEDGHHVRTIGRRGEGPGEFGGFSGPCMFPAPDGHVIVEDRIGRWQRFDTAGVLLSTQRSTSTLGCGIRELTQDDRFLAINVERDRASGESRAYFVVHTSGPGGELIPGDTVNVPETPETPSVTWVSADGRYRITSGLPFWPRPNRVLGPSGDFWLSDASGSYRVVKQSTAGDTLLILERAFEPIAIPDSTRERAIREFQREGMKAEDGFDPGQVPRVYPPFDQLIPVSDGTLWVSRTLGPGEVGLDVFSADGVYLGPVVLPGGFADVAIRSLEPDRVLGVVTDALGVQSVVRFGVRRPGG